MKRNFVEADAATHKRLKMMSAREGVSMKRILKMAVDLLAATRQAGRKTP